MKEGGDLLPSTAASPAAGGKPHFGAGDAAPCGRGRYKFWALGAILLLALWSMVTGTVTLRWSAGNLNRLSDGLDAPHQDPDLDVLEMEEREKVVRRMWDVYAHSHWARLPRFWQEAFEAAYEELASDDAAVHDAAVAEIARMSSRMVDLEPPPARHYHKNSIPGTGQRDEGSRTTVKSLTLSSVADQ